MKHLSTILLAILFSSTSFAQDYKFEIGIQGGPNYTAMRFKNDMIQEYNKPRMSASGSIFFQYNFSNLFSFRFDPGFESWSYKTKDFVATDPAGNIIGTIKIHTTFNYITLPILLRASLGNKTKVFFNAGPSFNVLLQEKNVVKGAGYSTEQKNTDQYKTLNMGIVAGIGIGIPIKENLSLSFEIRNNLGLTNINKNSNKDFGIKTNSTSLLVGLAYKFGSK